MLMVMVVVVVMVMPVLVLMPAMVMMVVPMRARVLVAAAPLIMMVENPHGESPRHQRGAPAPAGVTDPAPPRSNACADGSVR